MVKRACSVQKSNHQSFWQLRQKNETGAVVLPVQSDGTEGYPIMHWGTQSRTEASGTSSETSRRWAWSTSCGVPVTSHAQDWCCLCSSLIHSLVPTEKLKKQACRVSESAKQGLMTITSLFLSLPSQMTASSNRQPVRCVEVRQEAADMLSRYQINNTHLMHMPSGVSSLYLQHEPSSKDFQIKSFWKTASFVHR